MKKETAAAVIIGITLSLAGCGPGLATKIVRITPSNNSGSPIQVALCAAQQSGWSITFKDEQSLSATKMVGADHVPLSLNVALQQKDGATVTVNSARGEMHAERYQEEYLKAINRCGASSY